MADLYSTIQNMNADIQKMSSRIKKMEEKEQESSNVVERLDKIIELLGKNPAVQQVVYVQETSPQKDESLKINKNIDIIDKEYIPDINVESGSSSISKKKTEKKSASGLEDALTALDNLGK